MLMTRDKGFYSNFSKIFWPLVMQTVITTSVNLADNIMLGHYSETALAGAAAVNQLQFILQCLVGGVGGGLMVLGSQYWGQKRIAPIKKLSSIAFWIAIGFSAFIFAATIVAPTEILRIFTDKWHIIAEGEKYLKVIKYSYIVFAAQQILTFVMSSVETVKLAFWVSVETLIVNVGLNFVLIPAYGSEGAAAATLMARLVSLGVAIVYIARYDNKLLLKLRDFFSFDKALLRDFVKVTTPIVVISGLWGFSNALQTVILGHMEDGAIAANSAATTLYILFKSAAQGSAACAAIIMAKTVGAGDFGKVKEYSRTMQILFLGVGAVSAALLFIARIPVLAIYDMSADTMKLANQFILVLCVCCVGMAYQMPTITGIIRGGGDTRFGMINDIVSIWCIVLPLSAIAAFVWKWPPVAVIACLNSDQVFKCGAAALRCNRYKWVKKLTRDDA